MSALRGASHVLKVVTGSGVRRHARFDSAGGNCPDDVKYGWSIVVTSDAKDGDNVYPITLA
ncbi:MAG: hypothetical protein PHZ00_03860 [Candidatus Peribacteraceae bacterium]|nr:hypothetical protein [Candidatus Peribacteraceae bacterium]